MVKADDRICIVGAGPAGIATAHELASRGYRNVTILEKADRVGGLCLSEGFEGRAFDLGANYVTSAYKQVRRLAQLVGAEMYTEVRGAFFNPKTRVWRSIFAEAKGDASLFGFGWACLRYLYLRWRLDGRLPSTGYAGISRHPELCVDFDSWLIANRLTDLRTLCAIPVTLMGYGRLSEIPAPYVLTYLNLGTFRDLLLYGSGLPRSWPKRFIDGFQRLFERLAWRLDVRLNAEVVRVQRSQEGVTVHVDFAGDEQWLNKPCEAKLQFDWLVLCCPLQSISKWLDLTPEEKGLIERITINPFATTTRIARDPQLPTQVINVTGEVDVSPPRSGPLPPSIVTQQFADNPLVTFYTPLPPGPASSPLGPPGQDKAVVAGVKRLAAALDLDVEEHGAVFSDNVWPYFPHVSAADIAAGWYDRIETLQGTNRTWYNGGIMCFELIEPIVEYSRALAGRMTGPAR